MEKKTNNKFQRKNNRNTENRKFNKEFKSKAKKNAERQSVEEAVSLEQKRKEKEENARFYEMRKLQKEQHDKYVKLYEERTKNKVTNSTFDTTSSGCKILNCNTKKFLKGQCVLVYYPLHAGDFSRLVKSGDGRCEIVNSSCLSSMKFNG